MNVRAVRIDLLTVYERLDAAYGPQHWWPADTAFEVMVGAVLTQNTAWSNVERAIVNLRVNACLDAASIADAPHEQLAEWLRPSGYFNLKASRLRNFCRWYLERGGFEPLSAMQTPALRAALLEVNGIGRETADDILLYAFERPVFVIDAYTRRLFARLGFIQGDEPYEALREWVEIHLGRTPRNTPLFNQYHALIVAHAKAACRKRPACSECGLSGHCPAAALGKGLPSRV